MIYPHALNVDAINPRSGFMAIINASIANALPMAIVARAKLTREKRRE